MTLADLDAVHDRLAELLAAEHARLDAVYVCPHDLDECDCRKPAPGMLLRAAREHPGIDLGRAVIVGDAESDVAAGAAAGTATIRLASGPVDTRADRVMPDLDAAVTWILGS